MRRKREGKREQGKGGSEGRGKIQQGRARGISLFLAQDPTKNLP